MGFIKMVCLIEFFDVSKYRFPFYSLYWKNIFIPIPIIRSHIKQNLRLEFRLRSLRKSIN